MHGSIILLVFVAGCKWKIEMVAFGGGGVVLGSWSDGSSENTELASHN